MALVTDALRAKEARFKKVILRKDAIFFKGASLTSIPYPFRLMTLLTVPKYSCEINITR